MRASSVSLSVVTDPLNEIPEHVQVVLVDTKCLNSESIEGTEINYRSTPLDVSIFHSIMEKTFFNDVVYCVD